MIKSYLKKSCNFKGWKKENRLWLLFVLVSTSIIVVLTYLFNFPSHAGEVARSAISSDSLNYSKYYLSFPHMGLFEFQSEDARNFKFPLHFFYLLNGNIHHYLLLNLALFMILNRGAYNLVFYKQRFVILSLTFLYIYGSFSPPNKEIASALGLLALSYFALTRNIFWGLAAMIVAFGSRIEFFVFTFFCLVFFTVLNHVSEKTRTVLITLTITGILLGLSLHFGLYKNFRKAEADAVHLKSDIGVYSFLYNAAKNGGYFFLFPLNIFWNLFGNLHVAKQMLIGPNNILTYLSELWFLGVSFFLVVKKRLFLGPLGLLLWLYWITFSVSPTVIHRYLVPSYVVLVILASMDRKLLYWAKTQSSKSRGIHAFNRDFSSEKIESSTAATSL